MDFFLGGLTGQTPSAPLIFTNDVPIQRILAELDVSSWTEIFSAESIYIFFYIMGWKIGSFVLSMKYTIIISASIGFHNLRYVFNS